MKNTTLKFDPERIKAVREMKGLNMSRFARAIGKSRQDVFNWEKGGCIPDTSSLLKIANAFGISVGFFFVPVDK